MPVFSKTAKTTLCMSTLKFIHNLTYIILVNSHRPILFVDTIFLAISSAPYALHQKSDLRVTFRVRSALLNLSTYIWPRSAAGAEESETCHTAKATANSDPGRFGVVRRP
jgi:hypothetical protein